PDRDRTDRTQSRCAINEPAATWKRHENIVREFVLLDDVRWVYGRLLATTPGKDVVEPSMTLHESLKLVTLRGGQASVVRQRDCHATPRVRTTLRSAAKLHSGRASSAASHCWAACRLD